MIDCWDAGGAETPQAGLQSLIGGRLVWIERPAAWCGRRGALLRRLLVNVFQELRQPPGEAKAVFFYIHGMPALEAPSIAAVGVSREVHVSTASWTRFEVDHGGYLPFCSSLPPAG